MRLISEDPFALVFDANGTMNCACRSSRTSGQDGVSDGDSSRDFAIGDGPRFKFESNIPRQHAFSAAVAFDDQITELHLFGSAQLCPRTEHSVDGRQQLLEVNPGFRARHLLTARISLPQSKYRDVTAAMAFFASLEQGAQRLPGVESAGLTTVLPMTGPNSSGSTFIEQTTRAA